MRFLKVTLMSVLIYVAIFGVAALVANICGVTVQDSLITAVCGSAAVELAVGGAMKVAEMAWDKKQRSGSCSEHESEVS